MRGEYEDLIARTFLVRADQMRAIRRIAKARRISINQALRELIDLALRVLREKGDLPNDVPPGG